MSRLDLRAWLETVEQSARLWDDLDKHGIPSIARRRRGPQGLRTMQDDEAGDMPRM